MENLGLKHGKVRPIYIGDDRTDEDAFRALEQRGIGILVSEEPRFDRRALCVKESRRG